MSLKGKWRIVELDAFDDDYPDLAEPAYIEIGEQGHGQMAFGTLTAALDSAHTQSGFHFDWSGSDEGDQVCGEGWAELQPDGSLHGEISWHHGDETGFKAAPRATTSTAC
ncbi:MAG: hypothetical protein CGW95_05155 [Phenylobacterium zucineum]|nr:MAG: hypothetical protein CGW95_05155 [Phenylobacterium zucineum]